MNPLVLRNVTAGTLRVAGFELGGGLSPILARGPAGAALVAAIGGQLRGVSGTVQVAGADPRRVPAVRARIALLLAEEPATAARTVRQVVAEALSPAVAAEALAAIGLAAWAERDPRQLSTGERRSVALAIALGHPEPIVVAVYEPLADVPGTDRARVIARLRELGQLGAVVLPVTASVRDLESLGGHSHVLAQGQLHRVQGALGAAAHGPRGEFVLESAAARALGARLLERPAIAGITYDEGIAPRLLRVWVDDLRRGSLAILGGAAELAAPITSLRLEPPSLEAFEAAAAHAARAALERRSVAAPRPTDPWTVAMPFGIAPPPPPPPPGSAPAPLAAPIAAPLAPIAPAPATTSATALDSTVSSDSPSPSTPEDPSS